MTKGKEKGVTQISFEPASGSLDASACLSTSSKSQKQRRRVEDRNAPDLGVDKAPGVSHSKDPGPAQTGLGAGADCVGRTDGHFGGGAALLKSLTGN